MELQVREETVTRLGRIADLLHNYDHALLQEQAIWAPYRSKFAKPPLRRGVGVTIAWALAIGAALAIFIIPLIASLPAFRDSNDATRTLVNVWLFGTPAIALVASTIWTIVHNLRLPTRTAAVTAKNEQRAARLSRELAPRTRPIHKQYAQIRQELGPLVHGYYPDAYLHVEAVQFVTQMIANYRAESVGEAINLYENTLHQQRMENLAAAQYAEAQRASQIARNNALINAATLNAVMWRRW